MPEVTITIDEQDLPAVREALHEKGIALHEPTKGRYVGGRVGRVDPPSEGREVGGRIGRVESD
jgi:hypothetical protein